MLYDELLQHFGGLTRAAEALGYRKQTIHSWKVRGSIPFDHQYRIQMKTRGRLRADLRELDRKIKVA